MDETNAVDIDRSAHTLFTQVEEEQHSKVDEKLKYTLP
jgi:hypothetical protein